MTPNQWADFWRYSIGVNVIPAVTATKKPKVKWREDSQGNWQKNPIPEKLHVQWTSCNMFDEGMAIICGQVHHNTSKKDLWLNGIDCDNKIAIDEFCVKLDGTQGTIQDIAKDTLVEQHSNKEKCHILFYSKEPIKDKAPLQGENIPKLEIKSGGRFILYCSGGIHKDGSPIEILNKKIPSIVEKNRLEPKIDSIFKKYNLAYLTKSITLSDFQKPVYEIDGKLYEGNNRGIHILSYLDSKKIKNPELNTDDLFFLARKYEKENCTDVYDDEKIHDLVRQAMIYGQSKILTNDHSESLVTNNPKKKTVDQTAHLIESQKKFVTMRKTDDILMYNGKIYDDGEAQSVIKEEVEKIIDDCTTHQRSEVVNKIKAQTYTDDSFDSDVNTITIDNGILSLDTLQSQEHSADNLSRILIPLQYSTPEYTINDDTIFEDIEKNLKGTLFYKFLKSSFTINDIFKQDYFETCLEMYASVFVKSQIDEKAFINWGSGDNGKSVFLEYIESSVGKNNVSRVTLQDISEQTFMAAELHGKSANIFTDLEHYELKKSGKIKTITSGEGIQVQRKNKDPFLMYPFVKLIFSCNRFPKVYDQSQGFFRRWIIIKWERNFERDPERDVQLKQKLSDDTVERNKVFSCIIHLSRRLYRTGKFTHTNHWKDIQTEWNSNADPIDDFVSSYIVDSENNKTVREVYQFYKQKMFEKGDNPLRIGQFGKALSEYFDQDRIRNIESNKTERVWLNIGFKESVQKELENYHVN